MKSLILENDKYQMNWVEGTVEWEQFVFRRELRLRCSLKK